MPLQQASSAIQLDENMRIAQKVFAQLRAAERAEKESKARDALLGRFVRRELPRSVRDGLELIAKAPKRNHYGTSVRLKRSFRLWFHSRDRDLSLAELQKKRLHGERYHVPAGARLIQISANNYWIKWSDEDAQYGLQIERVGTRVRTSHWRLNVAFGFEPVVRRSHAIPGRQSTGYVPDNSDYDR